MNMMLPINSIILNIFSRERGHEVNEFCIVMSSRASMEEVLKIVNVLWDCSSVRFQKVTIVCESWNRELVSYQLNYENGVLEIKDESSNIPVPPSRMFRGLRQFIFRMRVEAINASVADRIHQLESQIRKEKKKIKGMVTLNDQIVLEY